MYVLIQKESAKEGFEWRRRRIGEGYVMGLSKMKVIQISAGQPSCELGLTASFGLGLFLDIWIFITLRVLKLKSKPRDYLLNNGPSLNLSQSSKTTIPAPLLTTTKPTTICQNNVKLQSTQCSSVYSQCNSSVHCILS